MDCSQLQLLHLKGPVQARKLAFVGIVGGVVVVVVVAVVVGVDVAVAVVVVVVVVGGGGVVVGLGGHSEGPMQRC